ncbi:unnamed protein product [Paramecium sonneborni]|uniref:GTP-binding protein n=1 Tax=Paramecium sonneborni TaxID=65129 RepID=A0A8S1RF77_9CILI|nr:unnamed protein product [Paramecium sonneborni]
MRTITKPGTIKINKNKDNYEQYKILVLGDPFVGKTSILDRYINGDFYEKYNSTIAVDFKHVQPSSNMSLNFWDFSGQQEFVEVRNEFYKDANMIMLVFDLSSRKTLETLDMWIREANDYGAANIPILVVGNKKEKRSMSENEGYNWAKQRSYQYIEVSAQQNNNIDLLFKVIKDIFTQKK